ncbi:MAG: M48 family metalloprotease [Myxococcota bacterium]
MNACISALSLCFALLFMGCATPYTPLPTLSAELNSATLDEDERYLWKKSSELQYEIERSGLLFADPALDAYLGKTLARVTPTELVAAGVEPRVAVISDVRIHGYSFANGVIYLHTALLSRMKDETQLATVLSRELAHVVNRHALRASREEKLRADTMAWVGIGASVGGEYGSGVKLLAQALEISSAVGFPAALETQADKKGLSVLADAGYDIRGTPEFFQGTVDYLAEIHTQGPWAWTTFIPPPTMTARIAGYRKLIQRSDSSPSTNSAGRGERMPAERFRRMLHGVTQRQSELELAAGLAYTAANTARLASHSNPNDPKSWYLLGKALEVQRANPIPGKPAPTVEMVREALSKAIQVDSRHADSVRELAMTHYRAPSGTRLPADTAEATRLFQRYLRLAPSAGDADYVRSYLEELKAERP